jgi:putative ABC transport system permease protein
VRVVTVAREFFADMRAQRLRTTLTILGITWGTVAVVALLAFGVGFKRQMVLRSKGIGDGIVIMFPGKTTKAFEGYPDGRFIRFRESDVSLLAHDIPAIGEISAEYGSRNAPVIRGTQVTRPYITGVYPIYGPMRNINVEPDGRFIDPPDMAERRRVVVLGDQIDSLLFGSKPAVGEVVLIGNTPFTVIGVMRPKDQSSSYNTRDKDRIFIPSTTYVAMFGDEFIDNIIYKPAVAAEHGAVEQEVYATLGRAKHFDPTDHDALGIWDTAESLKFFDTFFFGFNVFLAVVGSFTLTVGGIGVANIMYIVVRERTREIGIKRSVGATRRDILFQFLAEAVMIVAIGAAFGLALSWGLVALAGLVGSNEIVGHPEISGTVVAVTLCLLALIAAFAGLFPATRAAGLDPVEALRY